MQISCVCYLQTFTVRICFTFHLLCLSQLALAQFADDFSDNEFASNPPWAGDTAHFTVSDYQLKLNAPREDGSSFLVTPSPLAGGAIWEFRIKMEFNPSASNYTKVYLIADQANLNASLNGYFVMIGDGPDEISLYRQTGNSASKIIDGRDGLLSSPMINIGIRVSRDAQATWQLFTDHELAGNFTLEGTVADDTHQTSSYFGVLCSYTATRSDKFLFDDFAVREEETTDTIAPNLMSLETASSRELTLIFSEPLAAGSATNVQNFAVSPAVGNPAEAVLKPDHQTVLLTFDNPFSETQPSTLNVSNITDLAGNIMPPLNREFNFELGTKTQPKAVIISEIFADPSPPIGLPEAEFVEIYNRSEQAYRLAGWKLTDQSSTATLPDFILPPHEYAVLTAQNSDFPVSENVLRLSGFPSLNNTGDVLILRDAEGTTIDSVNYSDRWYNVEDKRSGGWTLEIIDPDNLCSEYQNWTASENDLGGTPGIENSVFANKPDLRGPKLLSAIPLSPVEIHLQFDERLEKELPDALIVDFNPVLRVESVAFADPSLTKLKVSLLDEIQPGVVYVAGTAGIYDCSGNVIQAGLSNAEFGLPEEADSLDVLINEILFNPRPTGVDFVEIVNASGKFINLKNWSLASWEDGILKNKTIVSDQDILLKPGEILALSENTNLLTGEYLTSKEQHFLQANKLPAFNDDQGSVAVLNASGRVIDSFSYNEDMHSVFLKDDEGVSLERISSSHSSADQNWKSASSSVGFATPGYTNSNAFPDSINTTNTVKVEPEIFNPLGAQDNFAIVHYNFEQGGLVANVKIFDSQGRMIKEIANNDIVGTSGFFRWDGDRDDGTKAGIGYYMVWVETFDNEGAVQNFQARVAIATTF